MICRLKILLPLVCCLIVIPPVGRVFCAEKTSSQISYHKEIVPLLKRSCTGCHHPGKLKGNLDLTTYEGFKKGGKNGPSFHPGDPKKSGVIEEITGDEPSMPKEGDALTKEEVALIARWIQEGATNDTPAEFANPFKLSKPPEYFAPPVISALGLSPDGNTLAVSGYHEVLLHKSDASGLIARLVGESPRIEAVAFSPNGRWLAVSGGAPSLFGEIQLWDLESKKLSNSFKISTDTLFGVSFSPESDRIAFGCADKTVRIISAADGKELVKFDNHSDWVLGTLFTVDGKRILSGSRDRAMKLIDASTGQFIDDINKLLEPVLCIARHPKEDKVIYGGELGTPRLYKISDNQNRTDANNDVNQIKEFERQTGPVRAVAFSPDGTQVALSGSGDEVRVYKTDGAKTTTLKGHEGAVFAMVYHPTRPQIITGGYDGKVRIFDSSNGVLVTNFIPVTIKPPEKLTTAK